MFLGHTYLAATRLGRAVHAGEWGRQSSGHGGGLAAECVGSVTLARGVVPRLDTHVTSGGRGCRPLWGCVGRWVGEWVGGGEGVATMWPGCGADMIGTGIVAPCSDSLVAALFCSNVGIARAARGLALYRSVILLVVAACSE